MTPNRNNTSIIKNIFEECLKPLPLAFIFSFLLWCFCFKIFLLNRSHLAFDAPPSYDHIKFFIDNLMQGVIPLWDYNEAYGSPNSFFLRRMGEFNPFYLLIIVFRTIGFSHTISYLLFLASYFFVGMLGFYFLANKLFNDRIVAFIAYLLLMFSSLGTRLFDSHIMFTAIPIIWFFYFLISFSKEQKKSSFLGITFSLMIILTTYIPFYFILIFTSFIATFIFIYFKNLKGLFIGYFTFINKNKIFALLCTFALLASLYPGYSFYKEGKSGSFVMPVRHSSSESSNQISVDIKNSSERSVSRELYVTFLFKNLKKIRFKVVYFPVLAYITLFICFFKKTSKLSFFLFLWGAFIFILSSTSLPIHALFYKHIFFFKFFRNFHFFVWLALLPIFTLFIAEQLRTLMNTQNLTNARSKYFYLYIILVHISFLVYLVISKNTIISSYVAVLLSFLFFSHYFSKFTFIPFSHMTKESSLLLLILTMIAIQPLEVFKYLCINETITPRKYVYDSVPIPSIDTYFTKGPTRISPLDQNTLLSKSTDNTQNLYYGTASFSDFLKLFSNELFSRYTHYRFYLYDQILKINETKLNAPEIANSLNSEKNLAFVSDNTEGFDPAETPKLISSKADPITRNSEQFRITLFDTNSLKIKTNLKQRKFLVFTDPFSEKWEAFVSNNPTKLYRTNVAFKGLWIPEGESTVFLRYGSLQDYAIKYLLFLLFYCCFGYLIFLSLNEEPKNGLHELF